MKVTSIVVLGLIWICLTPLPVSSEHMLSLTYISPRPSSHHVSAGTTIAIRQGSHILADSLQPDTFAVHGSVSGQSNGQALLADDQKTVIFKPDKPFIPGEIVSVQVKNHLCTEQSKQISGISFKFTISTNPIPDHTIIGKPWWSDQHPNDPQPAGLPRSYITSPESFGIPDIAITHPAQGTAEGYVLLSNIRFSLRPPPIQSTPRYLLILDNTGELVYHKELPRDQFAGDFKKQIVNGKELLSYHVGEFTAIGGTFGMFYVMDETYSIVDTWQAGNGYLADVHDLQLLDNGNALLMIYNLQTTDLSAYGGRSDAQVVDLIVQELDPSKNVIFEWRASEHIPYTDTYAELTDQIVDYIHGNAVEVDTDNNLLLSSRNLCEVTKINRDTGEVMWRLWGKQNQFTFTNDDGFCIQHDIRRLPNGNITLFDNQNARAVEYQIDEANKTVTRVWEYRDPTINPLVMGNAQRLPNGNTMIGWGSGGTITEVTPDAEIAMQWLLNGEYTYRVFRYPWKGFPTTAPSLALQEDNDALTLYFSWNGATEIASYRIYGGTKSHQMSLLETQEKQGFETTSMFTELPDKMCYFRIMPIDKDGNNTRYSNTVYRDSNYCNRYSWVNLYIPLVVQK